MGGGMLREERLWRITQRLTNDRQVLSSELAQEFGLTPASVRLDLAELERRGVARRVFGGAVLVSPDPARETLSLAESHFGDRVDQQRGEKEAIGAAAVELIVDGETIMIDGGTTTYEVCRHLAGHRGLTVISCAVNALWPELASKAGLEIFLTGGYLRPQSLSLVGEAAETMLRGVRGNKAVLGIDGISLEHGLTTLNFLEAGIKKRMIEASQELIIVADHTKLGRVGVIPVAPVERMAVLVTDSGAPDEMVVALRERGVKVILAQSFARIFFRNAVNVGLVPIICDLTDLETGDEIEISLADGVVRVPAKGIERSFEPLPPVMRAIFADGGLVNHILKRGGFRWDSTESY
jgi:DeoR family transcriptional regulator, fructose operon transcriptional repressor